MNISRQINKSATDIIQPFAKRFSSSIMVNWCVVHNNVLTVIIRWLAVWEKTITRLFKKKLRKVTELLVLSLVFAYMIPSSPQSSLRVMFGEFMLCQIATAGVLVSECP